MPRRPLADLKVSPSTRDAWNAYSRRRGVTVTGLLEAIAEGLAADPDVLNLAASVNRARLIDGERRQRQ